MPRLIKDPLFNRPMLVPKSKVRKAKTGKGKQAHIAHEPGHAQRAKAVQRLRKWELQYKYVSFKTTMPNTGDYNKIIIKNPTCFKLVEVPFTYSTTKLYIKSINIQIKSSVGQSIIPINAQRIATTTVVPEIPNTNVIQDTFGQDVGIQTQITSSGTNISSFTDLGPYDYVRMPNEDHPLKKVSQNADILAKLILNQDNIKKVPDFASLILDNVYPIYDIQDGHFIIPKATEKTVGGNISIPIVDKLLPIGLNTQFTYVPESDCTFGATLKPRQSSSFRQEGDRDIIQGRTNIQHQYSVSQTVPSSFVQLRQTNIRWALVILDRFADVSKVDFNTVEQFTEPISVFNPFTEIQGDTEIVSNIYEHEQPTENFYQRSMNIVMTGFLEDHVQSQSDSRTFSLERGQYLALMFIYGQYPEIQFSFPINAWASISFQTSKT